MEYIHSLYEKYDVVTVVPSLVDCSPTGGMWASYLIRIHLRGLFPARQTVCFFRLLLDVIRIP